ncbi:esterase/lipase family protein [Streptomyces sp. NPDC093225]|uniref:esterase/lipase family protein n=1 Tax=Streptomyces sp. NPDC093225 TaxID=3366034 RepID=UPI00380B3B39
MGLSLSLPATALRAAALELVILAGHLLLYPTGVFAERRPAGGRDGRENGHEGSSTARSGYREGSGERKDTRTDERGRTDVPLRPVAERPPVILLHGFTDNRSVFLLLRRALTAHGGRHVEALNYSPFTTDLRVAARLLGEHVEQVCARTGHDRVDLVGHSLGGLVARYYVQRLGGAERVRTVVTLGTPHGGTRVAPLMDAHPVVRQMRPDSPVLVELAAPAPGCSTRFVSFWSDLDQLMVPLETARLDHPDLRTENVRVSGIGHLALAAHPAVTSRIRQALDGPGDLDAAASDSMSVA